MYWSPIPASLPRWFRCCVTLRAAGAACVARVAIPSVFIQELRVGACLSAYVEECYEKFRQSVYFIRRALGTYAVYSSLTSVADASGRPLHTSSEEYIGRRPDNLEKRSQDIPQALSGVRQLTQRDR
jgi:hypothetical protein